MSKLELAKLLREVFETENINFPQVNPDFQKINIPDFPMVEFYSYGGLNKSQSIIWYVRFYSFGGNIDREIRFPDEMINQFLSGVFDISKKLKVMEEKTNIIKDDIKELSSKEFMRDLKIKSIIE